MEAEQSLEQRPAAGQASKPLLRPASRRLLKMSSYLEGWQVRSRSIAGLPRRSPRRVSSGLTLNSSRIELNHGHWHCLNTGTDSALASLGLSHGFGLRI